MPVEWLILSYLLSKMLSCLEKMLYKMVLHKGVITASTLESSIGQPQYTDLTPMFDAIFGAKNIKRRVSRLFRGVEKLLYGELSLVWGREWEEEHSIFKYFNDWDILSPKVLPKVLQQNKENTYLLQHNEIHPGGVLWVREESVTSLLGGLGRGGKMPSLGNLSKVSMCRVLPVMTQSTFGESPGWKSRVFLFKVKPSYLDERVVPVTWPTLATSALWHNAACSHWNACNVFQIANLKVNHSTTFLFFRFSNNSAESICIFLVIIFFKEGEKFCGIQKKCWY